jgi:hypothetical protein
MMTLGIKLAAHPLRELISPARKWLKVDKPEITEVKIGDKHHRLRGEAKRNKKR